MSNPDLKSIDPRLIATVAERAAGASPRLADALGGGAGGALKEKNVEPRHEID